MGSGHPDNEKLERLFRGRLPEADSREVVRHLVGGCASCAAAARVFWEQNISLRGPRTTGESGGWIEKLVRRLERQRRAARSERQSARESLHELLDQPAARQLLRVRNSRRFQTVALCTLVLERAFAEGLRDPSTALELAELGLAIARELDPERYGEALTHDMQARAWAYVANARRLTSDLRGAELGFARALPLLARGSGDLIEHARILCLKGYLRLAQRRFDESVRLFDRAIRRYGTVGDQHLVGKTMVDKGSTYAEAGDSPRAIRALRRGLARLDAEREPRAVLVAKHNLILLLYETGESEAALQLLNETRLLHRALGNPLDLLRFKWLEGKLLSEEGYLGEAEGALEGVIDGFVDRKMGYPAAIAAMDLAAVYLQRNRIGEMRRLASEVLPIFQSLNIHREAVVALTLFRKAVERESLDQRLIGQMSRYLKRSASRPAPRFRPTA